MNSQRFTAVKISVASALVGASLAACAPATMPPQQVQAVAGRYFGDDQLTVGTLRPLPPDTSKPPRPPAPIEGEMR